MSLSNAGQARRACWGVRRVEGEVSPIRSTVFTAFDYDLSCFRLFIGSQRTTLPSWHHWNCIVVVSFKVMTDAGSLVTKRDHQQLAG